jgi:hypothetical protein
MALIASHWKRTWTNVIWPMGKAVSLSTGECAVTPTSEVTSAMIRSLYRDFMHIIKIQEKQPIAMTTSTLVNPKDKVQKIRDEFRKPILNETSGTSNSSDTIKSRYQSGLNRFSFLRMNTAFYKPRSHYNASIANPGSDTGTERYIYKNGQRYPLNSVQEDATLRNDKRGYVVSPYDGKNLDPQSVTRHRKNLRRAGFLNNAHAKGFF